MCMCEKQRGTDGDDLCFVLGRRGFEVKTGLADGGAYDSSVCYLQSSCTPYYEERVNGFSVISARGPLLGTSVVYCPSSDTHHSPL